MSGWSDEEDNNFTAKISDFKSTNFEEKETTQTPMYQQSLTQARTDNKNYFHSRLGFEVGKFFEGERRIYTMRKDKINKSG